MSLALAETQLTTTPQPTTAPQPFTVGDRVRVRSEVLPVGYANRLGTVTEVRQVTPSGAVEIGLAFTAGHVVTWFRPAELEHAHRS